MKLALLGGGGFRVPLVFRALAEDVLGVRIADVSLYDTDAERLAVMERVTAEMARAYPEPPRVVATGDLAEAVTGADFVFSAIRVGGTRGRINDERVALELGLLGQETIGPGGLAYALRTVPVMHDIATTIREVAPQAWVINFTNPAGIVTEAMSRVLGRRVMGICDTPIGLVNRVARLFGVDANAEPERLEYDYAGLNHLGWLRELRIDGHDVIPSILADDAKLEQIEEARLLGFDWVRTTGALPNEYLFYYLFTDRAIANIGRAGRTRGEFLDAQQQKFYQAASAPECASPLTAWEAALREREATYMAETRDEDRREEDIAGGGYQEVALRLMSAIARGAGQRMILNVVNDGTLPQLPPDCSIEVPCVVDGDGVHALPVRPLTLPQLGLVAALKGAERDLIDAALDRDSERAWKAFAEHPLVSSPDLGRRLLDSYRATDPHLAALFGAPRA